MKRSAYATLALVLRRQQLLAAIVDRLANPKMIAGVVTPNDPPLEELRHICLVDQHALALLESQLSAELPRTAKTRLSELTTALNVIDATTVRPALSLTDLRLLLDAVRDPLPEPKALSLQLLADRLR